MDIPLISATSAALLGSVLIIGALLFRLRARETQLRDLRAAGIQTQARDSALAGELSSSNALRSALFEAAPDPILLLDPERQITALNAAARALAFGQPGHSIIESTRSLELDALAGDMLAPAESTGPELTRELVYKTRLYRARAARLEAGGMITLRDISELSRLGRARRDFVANISHELRTPLTAIRLLIETHERGAQPPTAPVRELLDQIGDQTSALTQMTQELSDLAQIESGQMPMRMVNDALRQTAAIVIARLAPQAERAGLTLANEIPEDMIALIDPAQIQRVLSNLIHNAIKFTESGGVTIFARRVGEDIEVGVRDTGAGLPAAQQARIFERFYKVDRARGQSGTGLGLAIAKHIVEAHGGAIRVESTLGAGATFYFTVPAET